MKWKNKRNKYATLTYTYLYVYKLNTKKEHNNTLYCSFQLENSKQNMKITKEETTTRIPV